MDLTKKRVSAEELHHLLIATFDRIKPSACASCSVPLPRLLPAVGKSGTNWWLGSLTDCQHGCASSIGWLWYQYGVRYEVVEDQQETVRT